MKQHLTLSISDTVAHIIHAKLTLTLAATQTLTISLPRWIPGSYLLRDFARHISHLCAKDAIGNHLPMTRIALGSWTLDAPIGDITIDYDVYAYDASVRACYLVPSYAFINPAACALYVEQWRDQPYQLNIPTPQDTSDWQVHTTCPIVSTNAQGFGLYQGETYDHLIDHPILIGNGIIIDWESADIPHRMVLVDEAPIEQLQRDKLISDLKAICDAQHQFWGKPPYQRYLFQVMVSADGYGGLEHCDSTALMTSRHSLPYQHATNHSAYEDFLGLCSHEYFHAWMVKRIKPSEFIRPNLQQAEISPLLWIFEGFTSLYDDWFLHRSGRIGLSALLTRWSDTINRTLPLPGGQVQSLADASREAWIKFYQPNENSNNTQVSYYTRGATIALALLGSLVEHQQHLDHLLHLWWSRWQAFPTQGLSHKQMIEDLSQLVPQIDWHAWMLQHIYMPDGQLIDYLTNSCARLGLLLKASVSSYTGLTTADEKGCLMVKRVALHSPAHKAGFMVGDELIAMNDWRTHQPADIEKILIKHEHQHPIRCLINRKGYLYPRDLLVVQMPTQYQLILDTEQHHIDSQDWLNLTTDLTIHDNTTTSTATTITRSSRKRIQRTQGSLF